MTYPSRHLAAQSLCRMYDQGQIDFDTWLACPIVQGNDGLWRIEVNA